MKISFSFLFLLMPFIFIGQTHCDDANSYLVSAYSHVKDAYEANNISHLKYYANRSFESFKLSRKELMDCGCKKALELAEESMALLAKVENTDTFEDGRFYVKRAKERAKESVIEVDQCAVNTPESKAIDTSIPEENQALTDLQNEQLRLQQQQEVLKLKEKQIKEKLAQQKAQVLLLKKQQLIRAYDDAISKNVTTYNETLKVCGCKGKTIKPIKVSENLTVKSIDDINTFYNEQLKSLASDYLSQLNTCP